MMAYLKTEEISEHSTAGFSHFKIKINVDVRGDFYCLIPDYLSVAVQGIKNLHTRDSNLKVFSDTLQHLLRGLHEAYRLYLKPDIKKEYVIQYYIASRVHFAEDKDGNIFPNARYENTQWAGQDGRYEETAWSAFNTYYGYSLSIGAEAKIKTTETFGTATKVTYSTYSKDGNHATPDNPATLLNSWCHTELPEDPKEIPYTDEAAAFFYNLMMGMAKLAQQIQAHTFDQDNLLALINSGVNLLEHK